MTVFLFALITALATGLGALPFAIRRSVSSQSLGSANAAAAGLMLAASTLLLAEGIPRGITPTVIGLIVGVLFIEASRWLLKGHEHPTVGSLTGADARKAILIIAVMTIHSVTEGVGVGVSFGGGLRLGLFITVAIAVHNIPEGLAISLVLIPRGLSVGRAALWSVATSLPQPVMAVPAFVFVGLFEPLLPSGLGFAAGAMVSMVLREILPDAIRDAPLSRVVGITGISMIVMLILQFAVL